MSEDEKKRRIEYKKNRKKWILIQVIILAVLSAMVLTTAFSYYRVNKTYYIDYTEQSNIDYSVQLEPNSFLRGRMASQGSGVRHLSDRDGHGQIPVRA